MPDPALRSGTGGAGPSRRTAAGAVLALTLLAGCTDGGSPGGTPAAGPSAVATTATPGPSVAAPVVETRDDLAGLFQQAGLRGTFVLYDVSAGRVVMVDRERAERRLIPASTFKIPHSLIALETGVVRDEHEKIPYGGRPQRVAAWERDMGLRDAIRVSNVPVFQELARRIGPEREREWLNRLGYGNGEVGPAVDRFWLNGPLEISADEQARWLARLARGELPANPAHQATVRDILRLERTAEHSLYGKTGLTDATEPGTGWWVGWVERGDRLYTFALNVDVTTDAAAEQRLPLGRRLLHRLGALPTA
ncbi:beta-lactamase class D [Micromonospora echinaurantiaca]|uniref:Beta-lactamase n=1 Tax=Micromonospora echinaurantiaca TaxID=47857 RepID=A0A1C5IEN9_9ACTN|nr:class D beta-lactamase [Micromonospora echinaurantiaca]SCG56246.1 beta-lactamase class D [Micromonospora echinaurantiaca]